MSTDEKKTRKQKKSLFLFPLLFSSSFSPPLLHSTYGPPTLAHCSLPAGSLRHSSIAPTAFTIETASPFFVQ